MEDLDINPDGACSFIFAVIIFYFAIFSLYGCNFDTLVYQLVGTNIGVLWIYFTIFHVIDIFPTNLGDFLL